MNGARHKGIATELRSRAVLTAVATLSLCLPAASLIAQHPNSGRPAPAPRYSAPRQQSTRPQAPRQSSPQYQNNRAPQQYPSYRPPAGTQLQRNPYTTPAYNRTPYPGTAQQLYAPPGHLGAWLNTHRDVPVQQQQQMLRNDPSFRRLAPGEQQRLMNQLHQVNQMPDAQRERRLARAENLERLSPEDRAQVAASARRWTSLPQDRQAMMRNAFRDLRAVPPDQRSIVLNSSRYQGQFSPEERGILSNMLRVEPYAPPQ
jgi:hypothetical protein